MARPINGIGIMTAQTAIPESRRLDFSEVPIIDLAALVRGCDDQASISQLEVACRDVGFVYEDAPRLVRTVRIGTSVGSV